MRVQLRRGRRPPAAEPRLHRARLVGAAQGELKAWGARRDAVNAFAFSSDETTLFVSRTTSLATPGNFLQRIALATGLVTRFPATGYAAQVLSHTNDRHLVWLQSTDVTLVTTTSDYPSVFAAATQLVANPTPMALSACAAALCSTLKVLAPTATVAHPVSPTAGSFDLGVFGSATSLGGTGDSPFLLNGGGGGRHHSGQRRFGLPVARRYFTPGLQPNRHAVRLRHHREPDRGAAQGRPTRCPPRTPRS